MAHLTKSILIHAPVEKVVATAQDPHRWPAWYDGMGEIEKLTGEGEVGTVAEFHYEMAGMKFPVTTKVLEVHASPEGARWKGRIEGPLAGEHTWTYTPKGDDTEVSANIEYTVPGSALGKIADRLFIERTQANSAERTLQNLKSLCESG